MMFALNPGVPGPVSATPKLRQPGTHKVITDLRSVDCMCRLQRAATWSDQVRDYALSVPAAAGHRLQ